MITRLDQVMLYVNDQQQSVRFWTEKVGFHVLAKNDDGDDMKWIEIAPSHNTETSIVLQDKAFISQMEPELNLGTPSLMFFSENLDELYNKLQSQQVKVGEMMTMPSGRVFNFADDEDNYFAVMEKSE